MSQTFHNALGMFSKSIGVAIMGTELGKLYYSRFPAVFLSTALRDY